MKREKNRTQFVTLGSNEDECKHGKEALSHLVHDEREPQTRVQLCDGVPKPLCVYPFNQRRGSGNGHYRLALWAPHMSAAYVDHSCLLMSNHWLFDDAACIS